MCVCIWLASLYITIVAGHVDMKYCISFTYFEWKLSTNVYLINSLSNFQLYIYIYILNGASIFYEKSEINSYLSIKWQKLTKTRPSNANIKRTYHARHHTVLDISLRFLLSLYCRHGKKVFLSCIMFAIKSMLQI